MKAAKLEIGDRRPEARCCGAGGKRKKEGVERSVFTLMRCSLKKKVRLARSVGDLTDLTDRKNSVWRASNESINYK
ncbi:hypothetical protein [Microcoleus sp. LEGE 07076]|uniref:hypothetical protein n=1 Tax=Microcoleus sp. LEGE 07076 TaxID=915322 RepID=UPI00187E4978|nr:hypothetical protein [Microcoleus sp. LEGE 07076]